MEKELNIAAILKDKQENTKLYSTLYSDVYFKKVCSYCDYHILVAHHGSEAYFQKDGRVHKDGEVCLFPSKKMRDWSKFAWKKGDVLVSNDGDRHIIFKGFSKDDYTAFEGKHWISVSKKRHVSCLNMQNVQDYHIEDNEDDAQTYINTIEEKLGGKLNMETLEIEKAEFKDGDIVYADYGHKQAVFIVSGKTNLSEGYNSFIALDLRVLTLDMGCRMSFFKKDLCNLRPATDEERQRLFDTLAKENKKWDAEQKAIVNLPKKSEFKIFQKVLVRNYNGEEWIPGFFFRIHNDGCRYILVCGEIYKQCIPYNDHTEHLLGTTDELKGGEG